VLYSAMRFKCANLSNSLMAQSCLELPYWRGALGT
jgi:hypothetical protein